MKSSQRFRASRPPGPENSQVAGACDEIPTIGKGCSQAGAAAGPKAGTSPSDSSSVAR